MLLVFRLYQKHPIGVRMDYPFSSDLSAFSHAILHLRDSAAHQFRLYDLDIIPVSLEPPKHQRKDDTMVSPMHIEFAVFVEKKSADQPISLLWFSLMELWHFLYNDNGIHKIPINDRIASHLTCWKKLVTGVDSRKDQEKKTVVGCHPFAIRQSKDTAVPWTIDKDTIFISHLALWHFIFSSPCTERASFLIQILEKYIYPETVRIMQTGMVEVMDNPPHEEEPSRLASVRSWLTACCCPLRRQSITINVLPVAHPYQHVNPPQREIKTDHATRYRDRGTGEEAASLSGDAAASVPAAPYHPDWPASDRRYSLVDETAV